MASSAAPGPDKVRLKRRRDELPPDTLIVERESRETAGQVETESTGSQRKRVFSPNDYSGSLYVRVQAQRDAVLLQERAWAAVNARRDEEGANADDGAKEGETQLRELRDYAGYREGIQDGLSGRVAGEARVKRMFHLKRPATLLQKDGLGPHVGMEGVNGGSTKRRRGRQGDGDSIATFVEARSAGRDLDDGVGGDSSGQLPSSSGTPALKRPGRGARTLPQASSASGALSDQDQKAAEAAAQRLQQFALDELEKEQFQQDQQQSRPKITAKPRLAPARSRELHRAGAATRNAANASIQTPSTMTTSRQDGAGDVDMGMGEEEDDSDYIYETYILAPRSQATTNKDTPIDPSGKLTSALDLANLGNVGYLIISTEDAPLWEQYILDEGYNSDGSHANSGDDEDSNAEDYYGADYPEDELASDDEYDRGGASYRYRARAGSDDEHWSGGDEEDEVTWSDEEDMRMSNPFSSTRPVRGRFAKYFSGGAGAGAGGDDDND